MKYRFHINISFKWFDFWIGFYIDKPAKTLYLCILPMLPIKVWISKHETCPICGAAMDKTAVNIAPEGFDLFWNCFNCENKGDESYIPIEWNEDFSYTDLISVKDLKRFGYVII